MKPKETRKKKENENVKGERGGGGKNKRQRRVTKGKDAFCPSSTDNEIILHVTQNKKHKAKTMRAEAASRGWFCRWPVTLTLWHLIAIFTFLLPWIGGASASIGGSRDLQVSCPNDSCIISDVLDNYPYIVSLRIRKGDYVGGCTGSLVSDAGWIMTAAHCVYDDDAEEVPEDTEVEVTFAPDSRDGQNYDQSVTIPYEDIYINPGYGNNGDGEGMWNDDIALLKFDPDGKV